MVAVVLLVLLVANRPHVGEPRYVPLLRRGVDVPDQERYLQVPAAGRDHSERHD